MYCMHEPRTCGHDRTLRASQFVRKMSYKTYLLRCTELGHRSIEHVQVVKEIDGWRMASAHPDQSSGYVRTVNC